MSGRRFRAWFSSLSTQTAKTSTTAMSASWRSGSELSPGELVERLDSYLIGQHEAKRAVAVALRERWRRHLLLNDDLKREVVPSNILMSGPTGCGKSATAERLSKIVNVPFVKVEASRYTETGIVGASPESMINHLVTAAVTMHMNRQKLVNEAAVERSVEETIVRELSLTFRNVSKDELKEGFRMGLYDSAIIRVDVRPWKDPNEHGMSSGGMPHLDQLKSMMDSISMTMGSKGSKVSQTKEMSVKEAIEIIKRQEHDVRMDMASIKEVARRDAEENGIIFIDEIDKIVRPRDGNGYMHVKGENVQKELLHLLEGSQVVTTYGPVKTHHILFIAAGAFHLSKPSDLLPELQGRLPIRVNFDALGQNEFEQILRNTRFNLLEQQIALMKVEGVELSFTEEAVSELARISADLNATVENTGARRLRTVLAAVMSELSFLAPLRRGESISVDAEYVRQEVGKKIKGNMDLRKYML